MISHIHTTTFTTITSLTHLRYGGRVDYSRLERRVVAAGNGHLQQGVGGGTDQHGVLVHTQHPHTRLTGRNLKRAQRISFRDARG